MRKDKLPTAPQSLCSDFIEHVGEPCPKKPARWKVWTAVIACLAVVCTCCVLLIPRDNGGESTAIQWGPVVDNTQVGRPNWYGDGIQPCLRYNGKPYYWQGISKQKITSRGNHGVSLGIPADTSSYLPEGCQQVGEISGCTLDIPTEELQLQADFETYGPVYQNPANPEALYAYVANTWGDAGDFYYVRFVTDALCNSELISWNGQLYRIAVGRTDITPWLKELPEDCTPIGNLSFVGEDTMPAGDLETNQLADPHSYTLDGREVLAVPGDDSVIYVYAHRYWAKGDYPAWLACYLWE